MTWSRIIRRSVTIFLASALAAIVAASVAGESWTWSDRLGFGAFAIAMAVGTVTMVWGHRMHQL